MRLFKKIKNKRIEKQKQIELLEKHRIMFLNEIKQDNPKSNEAVKLEDAISTMGNLEYNGSLYEGRIESTIFGKIDNIKLYVYVDDETDPNITKAQLETYKHIIENRKNIENDIIKELEKNYKIEDVEKIKTKFKPISIMIFSNGNSGMALITYIQRQNYWSGGYVDVYVENTKNGYIPQTINRILSLYESRGK